MNVLVACECSQTVFVYRRIDDNIYCSDECASRDGNFCLKCIDEFKREME